MKATSPKSIILSSLSLLIVPIMAQAGNPQDEFDGYFYYGPEKRLEIRGGMWSRGPSELILHNGGFYSASTATLIRQYAPVGYSLEASGVYAKADPAAKAKQEAAVQEKQQQQDSRVKSLKVSAAGIYSFSGSGSGVYSDRYNRFSIQRADGSIGSVGLLTNDFVDEETARGLLRFDQGPLITIKLEPFGDEYGEAPGVFIYKGPTQDFNISIKGGVEAKLTVREGDPIREETAAMMKMNRPFYGYELEKVGGRPGEAPGTYVYQGANQTINIYKGNSIVSKITVENGNLLTEEQAIKVLRNDANGKDPNFEVKLVDANKKGLGRLKKAKEETVAPTLRGDAVIAAAVQGMNDRRYAEQQERFKSDPLLKEFAKFLSTVDLTGYKIDGLANTDPAKNTPDVIRRKLMDYYEEYTLPILKSIEIVTGKVASASIYIPRTEREITVTREDIANGVDKVPWSLRELGHTDQELIKHLTPSILKQLKVDPIGLMVLLNHADPDTRYSRDVQKFFASIQVTRDPAYVEFVEKYLFPFLRGMAFKDEHRHLEYVLRTRSSALSLIAESEWNRPLVRISEQKVTTGGGLTRGGRTCEERVTRGK